MAVDAYPGGHPDCSSRTDPPWSVPALVTVMEWGPKGEDGWWDTHESEVEKYYVGADAPIDNFQEWNAYVRNVWEGECPLDDNGGFRLTEALDLISSSGFLHACYNSHQIGSAGDPKANDMGSAVATRMKDAFVNDMNGPNWTTMLDDDDDQTPVLDYYHAILNGTGGSHVIPNFVVHSLTGCPCEDVCPTCN